MAVQRLDDELIAYLEAIPEAREFPLRARWGGSALSSALGSPGWLNANEQAFLTAARRGDVESVKRLLRVGVSPDRADDFGITALMRAAAWGHVPVVDALLAAGASTAPSRDGLTALHYARSADTST